MKRTISIYFVMLCLIGVTVAVTVSASERAVVRNKTEVNKERRVALVIGNGGYQVSPLNNPVNDARAMSSTLTKLGFQVMEKVDVSEKEMKQAIDAFGDRIGQGGVGLFYFAGHGMQVNGENYLIPVNARITSEQDVEYEAVRLGRVLAKMAAAGNRLNLVILDGCRDNPFKRSFRSAAKGLALVDAPSGTLIAYATSPNKTASDGPDQENGLYTEKLLKYMQMPGLKVEDVFKRVRQEVQNVSGKDQTPWEASSLVGDFYFVPPDPIETPTPVPDTLEAAIAGMFDPSTTTNVPAKSTPRPGKEQANQENMRFINNGNGTVTDRKTGLIWLKNANCFGSEKWAASLDSAKTLAGGRCGLTDGSVAGDWRLPSKDELLSLIDTGRKNPALPADHLFFGVQSGSYWSSTTYTYYSDGAWIVDMYDGGVGSYDKAYNLYVWPVSVGNNRRVDRSTFIGGTEINQ
ncbi:MAG: caspase family protein [Deltaproteobacteria bacterium]|nr:caspase family protein [Deltaproteobacteria bacterium]